MAICVNESWTTIIVNVDSINRCYQGGILQFLANEFPVKSKSFMTKIKSSFIKPKIEDYDSIDIASGVHVYGTRGCDGNLFFLSTSIIEEIKSLDEKLASFGLVSNKLSHDCDYYIFTDNDLLPGKKMLCKWLQIDYTEAADTSEDKSIQFSQLSICPFKMPYKPSKFKTRQGGFIYDTQRYWEECQKATKDGNPDVIFNLSAIAFRHHNFSLQETIPDLDTFIAAYISGDKSQIPSRLWFILDGSKDRDDQRRRIILYSDKDKEPPLTQDKQIINDLVTAWRTLSPELLIQHLAPEFRYDSMWVFESLDHDGYVDYIREKFNTINRSGSQLFIQEVPGRNAISISQDGKDPAFYIIEIEHGKIVRANLTAFI